MQKFAMGTTYDRQTLLDLQNQQKSVLTDGLRAELRALGLLRSAAFPEPASRKRSLRKRCARSRKRGKRAGVRAKLMANSSRPAVPSLLLSNVCSLPNKIDYLRLQRTSQREFRDCCVFVFTETWLTDSSLDSAIEVSGMLCYRADRDAGLSGKVRGGGVCVYINTAWCNNAALISSYCSPLVEFAVVRARPFYLPRELSSVYIIAVYVAPSANANANGANANALQELYTVISKLQNSHPDGLFIVAGDFNHSNLKALLPSFHQHVDFPTRGANLLDCVYTNIPGSYRAEPRPHYGYSDHISVMLIPAYRQLIRRAKSEKKQVTTWPPGAISALQDCFEHTDWDMFREAATSDDSINLEEYTDSA